MAGSQLLTWVQPRLGRPRVSLVRMVAVARRSRRRATGAQLAACLTSASVGAAALAGLSGAQVERNLMSLANAHLIEQVGPGRYGFHDLMRCYAEECAAIEDSPELRSSAIHRLFDWYLVGVECATLLLSPNFLRLPLKTFHIGEIEQRFGQANEALAWLDEERQNLLASIRFAATNTPNEVSWLLISGLRAYLSQRSHYSEWILAAEATLDSAEKAGNAAAQASSHLALAHVSRAQFQFGRAAKHLKAALKLGEKANWPEMQTGCLGNLGGIAFDTGTMQEAISFAQQSIALSTKIGRAYGVALATSNLGFALGAAGRLQESEETLRRGVELHQRPDIPTDISYLLGNRGEVLVELGRLREGHECLLRAIRLKTAKGDNRGLAFVLVYMSRLHRAAGHFDSALEIAGRAAEIAERIGDMQGDAEARLAIGAARFDCGDIDAALAEFRMAAARAKSAGLRHPRARASVWLAAAHAELDQLRRGRQHAEAGLRLARAAGFGVVEGMALGHLASISWRLGGRDEALVLAREALANHEATGHRFGIAQTLRLLAQIHPDPEVATRHMRAAEGMFADIRSQSVEDLESWRDAIIN